MEEKIINLINYNNYFENHIKIDTIFMLINVN